MRHKSMRKLHRDPAKGNHVQTRSRRSSSDKHRMLELQQSIGNHAMHRLISSDFIQPKPVDHTADRAAGSVMHRPGVAVGYGRTGNLHGKTVGAFDGGKKWLEKLQVSPSTGCDCLGTHKCMIATATLAVKYNVKVTTTMPQMPGGLSQCEQRVVRAFMDNVLGPHEAKHKRLMETYNTTTRRPIEARGCGRDEAKSALDTEAELLHAAEAATREKDAISKSDAIDPFFDMYDTSSCDTPRRP